MVDINATKSQDLENKLKELDDKLTTVESGNDEREKVTNFNIDALEKEINELKLLID
jgi:SMC interacting uncharacterized protein involved in chromosome segregation